MTTAQTLQVVLALVFIVALLLVMAWLARHSGWVRQRISRTDMKVLGTLRLGTRSSIALIQVHDARLVVGVTPQQITLLHVLTPGLAGTDTGADFGESLNKVMTRS